MYPLSSNLEYSSLANAQVNGAQFAGATLTGISSGGATGLPASLPTNWTFVGLNSGNSVAGCFVGPDADLQNADLAFICADTGHCGEPGAVYPGIDFQGADLQNANLEGFLGFGINFTEANLSERTSALLGANRAT